jgi:hypothetical protein
LLVFCGNVGEGVGVKFRDPAIRLEYAGTDRRLVLEPRIPLDRSLAPHVDTSLSLDAVHEFVDTSNLASGIKAVALLFKQHRDIREGLWFDASSGLLYLKRRGTECWAVYWPDVFLSVKGMEEGSKNEKNSNTRTAGPEHVRDSLNI